MAIAHRQSLCCVAVLLTTCFPHLLRSHAALATTTGCFAFNYCAVHVIILLIQNVFATPLASQKQEQHLTSTCQPWTLWRALRISGVCSRVPAKAPSFTTTSGTTRRDEPENENPFTVTLQARLGTTLSSPALYLPGCPPQIDPPGSVDRCSYVLLHAS